MRFLSKGSVDDEEVNDLGGCPGNYSCITISPQNDNGPKKPGWKDDAGKFYIKVKQSLPKIQK